MFYAVLAIFQPNKVGVPARYLCCASYIQNGELSPDVNENIMDFSNLNKISIMVLLKQTSDDVIRKETTGAILMIQQVCPIIQGLGKDNSTI